MILGEPPFGEVFHMHFRDQPAIPKMRDVSQFSSPVGRSFFASANRMLLWRDLGERKRPTRGILDWPPRVYSSWLGDISARLTVRVAVDV